MNIQIAENYLAWAQIHNASPNLGLFSSCSLLTGHFPLVFKCHIIISMLNLTCIALFSQNYAHMESLFPLTSLLQT